MSSEMIAIVALFFGPIVAIVTSIIAAKVARKNGVEGTNISRRQADTNEFSAMTEGFTESFRQMHLQIQELKGRVGALELEKDSLAEKLHDSTIERAELLAHLLAVEALVPTPPGPPTRPTRIAKSIV